MQFDLKNNSILWMTYSGIQGLRVLVLDWFCLLGIPGSDWDGQEALKFPGTMKSCQHFVVIFQVLFLFSRLFLAFFWVCKYSLCTEE